MKIVDPAPAEIAGLAERYPEFLRPRLKTRIAPAATAAAILGLFVFGLVYLDFSPARLLDGLVALARFAALMVPPSPEGHFLLFAQSLAETLAIALLGTLTASILAFPFGLAGARNVVANPIIHFLVRRVLDIIRSVDTLVWALLWIAVVGLGPFAGVLAIASSDLGALGKLFAETLETGDARALEGVRAAGGARVQGVRFGILPQALPVLAGQALYFFESNTRSATIIGIVGAGGVGLHLYEAIRTLEWREVSFIVLMILVAVAIIDFGSSRLRAAMGAKSAG
ncbi:MAG TPA: phosphonate ABC transporter, permease protein PhnE [Roseiarcus sp.]|nr:phosphonate ABC transporter, permease protein PhnE [Roseiarcus sp.]